MTLKYHGISTVGMACLLMAFDQCRSSNFELKYRGARMKPRSTTIQQQIPMMGRAHLVLLAPVDHLLVGMGAVMNESICLPDGPLALLTLVQALKP